MLGQGVPRMPGWCVSGMPGCRDAAFPGCCVPAPGSAPRCQQTLLSSRRKLQSPPPLSLRAGTPRPGVPSAHPSPPGTPWIKACTHGCRAERGPPGTSSRGWAQSSPPRSPPAPAQRPVVPGRGASRAGPAAEGGLGSLQSPQGMGTPSSAGTRPRGRTGMSPQTPSPPSAVHKRPRPWCCSKTRWFLASKGKKKEKPKKLSIFFIFFPFP